MKVCILLTLGFFWGVTCEAVRAEESELPTFPGLRRLNSEFNFPLKEVKKRSRRIAFDSNKAFTLNVSVNAEGFPGVLFSLQSNGTFQYIFVKDVSEEGERRYTSLSGKVPEKEVERVRKFLKESEFDSWEGRYISSMIDAPGNCAAVMQERNVLCSLFGGHYTKKYLELEEMLNSFIRAYGPTLPVKVLDEEAAWQKMVPASACCFGSKRAAEE